MRTWHVLGLLFLAVALLYAVGYVVKRVADTDGGGDPELAALLDEARAFVDQPLPVVTAAEFQAIRNGMTYKQVRGIVGEPGELTVDSSVGGITTKAYQWMNADGSNMMIMTQQGKVVTKAQAGLR